MTKYITLGILMASMMSPTFAYAHSGGTNAAGCHAGSKPYHCHNAKKNYSTSSSYTYNHPNGEEWRGYARSTCSNYVSRYGGYCTKE